MTSDEHYATSLVTFDSKDCGKFVTRGMVSMVSMEVSKTLGPGSSPGTPAIN